MGNFFEVQDWILIYAFQLWRRTSIGALNSAYPQVSACTAQRKALAFSFSAVQNRLSILLVEILNRANIQHKRRTALWLCIIHMLLFTVVDRQGVLAPSSRYLLLVLLCSQIVNGKRLSVFSHWSLVCLSLAAQHESRRNLDLFLLSISF